MTKYYVVYSVQILIQIKMYLSLTKCSAFPDLLFLKVRYNIMYFIVCS